MSDPETPAQLTYLELSQDVGSHKFYEVQVRGCEVSIRYGRIGESGQTQSKTFASHSAAQAEAAKKLRDKQRKGYAPAVAGERQKRERAVTRRTSLVSESRAPRSSARSQKAELKWNFTTHSAAFGIYVNAERAWMGNEAGLIYALSHEGEVLSQFHLPDGVKCLIDDGRWLYAGCDDGNVYDLSAKLPRLAYEIAENIDIYWLDIHDALLSVSDAAGKLTLIDHNDEFVWEVQSPGRYGWMTRSDATATYHGTSAGVSAYHNASGELLWRHSTGQVLFGAQTAQQVFAGTSERQVIAFDKSTQQRQVYACDSSVMSCTTSPDGAFVYAGDGSGALYGFAASGERLWKRLSGCGSAMSMQYYAGHLYFVTGSGSFACLALSEAGLPVASGGAREVAAPPVAASQAHVQHAPELVRQAGAGVVLECRLEGSKLRVFPTTANFDQALHVQFPRYLRQAGRRYVVDGLELSANASFYRVVGEIRQLKD